MKRPLAIDLAACAFGALWVALVLVLFNRPWPGDDHRGQFVVSDQAMVPGEVAAGGR